LDYDGTLTRDGRVDARQRAIADARRQGIAVMLDDARTADSTGLVTRLQQDGVTFQQASA
jgi:hypothetical protein